jgi:hypothetical protein
MPMFSTQNLKIAAAMLLFLAIGVSAVMGQEGCVSGYRVKPECYSDGEKMKLSVFQNAVRDAKDRLKVVAIVEVVLAPERDEKFGDVWAMKIPNVMIGMAPRPNASMYAIYVSREFLESHGTSSILSHVARHEVCHILHGDVGTSGVRDERELKADNCARKLEGEEAFLRYFTDLITVDERFAFLRGLSREGVLKVIEDVFGPAP